MAETRAEKIERALRDLTVAVNRVAFTHRWADEAGSWSSRIAPDEATLCAAHNAALASLALPREESAEGWIVRPKGATGLLHEPHATRFTAEVDAASTEGCGVWSHASEIVRVRITAAPEGEEGTP